MGNRQVAVQARAAGYRLDPTSLLRRTRGAESDRRVTLRPAPDTMTLLTGFLPVAQGVAVHTALRRHADSLRSQGDDRSIGQIMADTLVARCTGQADAVGTPVEIQLVMTDHALLGGGDEPALVPGHGPIPAWLGRRLVREADKAWVRRLFVSPTTRELVAMASRRRLFPGKLRDFLVLRDEVCRTPWCDAPVRHVGHPQPHARRGSTTSDNAQGLCENCNYVKETPGYRHGRGLLRHHPVAQRAGARHASTAGAAREGETRRRRVLPRTDQAPVPACRLNQVAQRNVSAAAWIRATYAAHWSAGTSSVLLPA